MDHSQNSQMTDVTVKKKKNWIIPVVIGGVLLFLTLIASVVLITVFAVPKAGLKKHLNLGDKYLTDMDYENAILAYKDAIEIDPKCEEAYIGLADAYEAAIDEALDSGDYDYALELIKDEIRDMKQGEGNTGSDDISKRLDDAKDRKAETEEKKDFDKKDKDSDATDENNGKKEDEIKIEEKRDGWKEAYVKVLESEYNSSFASGINDISLVHWGLFYLDDDDIPELLYESYGEDELYSWSEDGLIEIVAPGNENYDLGVHFLFYLMPGEGLVMEMYNGPNNYKILKCNDGKFETVWAGFVYDEDIPEFTFDDEYIIYMTDEELLENYNKYFDENKAVSEHDIATLSYDEIMQMLQN